MAIAPNQGIMALPENQAMQAPQLSLSDSYDSMRQALQTARPDADMEMEEMLSGIRPMLNQLTDEQLSQLIEEVKRLYDNPKTYASEVAKLVQQGSIDEGDLPAEYDEEFLSAFLMMLIDAQRSRGATASASNVQPEAPMGMSVPQGFARGGIAEAARIVASQGRYGDTMLAHITPEEARFLKARGGSGTINPVTGLPEFWNPLKIIKNAVKSVGKVVKEVLKNPIVKIVATVALGTMLGPGALGISGLGLSAGAAGAISSGAIAALSGGDLKSILTSAAVGFLSAPGGPVSNYIGKYTGQFLTNPIVREAATGAIIGTGAGLISGQNLKDAVKSGLVEGAIAGGVAYFSGAGKVQADKAATAAAADATVNGPKLDAPALTPLEKLDELDTQAAIDDFTGANKPTVQGGAGQAAGPASYKYQLRPDGVTYFDTTTGLDVPTADAARMRLDASTRKPGLADAVGQAQAASQRVSSGVSVPSSGTGLSYDPIAGVDYQPQAGIDYKYEGSSGTPSTGGGGATAPYKPGGPGIGESFGQMGSGAKKFMTGDFSAGAGEFAEGVGNLFAPGPSNEQIMNYAKENNVSFEVADKVLSPPMYRSYGPTIATGLGALALSGGFNSGDTPEQQRTEEMREKMYGTPGLDLVNANPSNYLAQGLPGLTYNQQGNIIGSRPYSSPYTLQDIRVGTRYPSQPTFYADGGIAALMQGGYPRKVGQISGPGTEKSDSIPAMLSDGEFVMTASAVRGAGGGSRREGAKRMYALMHQLERNAARG